MQIEQCLVELHIPQYTSLWPQMQALISNNQKLRFRRNENMAAAVYNRVSYSFDISHWQSPPYKGSIKSIKYVMLRGSEKVWQFVTGGVKIMWRHTVSFFTIHNF